MEPEHFSVGETTKFVKSAATTTKILENQFIETKYCNFLNDDVSKPKKNNIIEISDDEDEDDFFIECAQRSTDKLYSDRNEIDCIEICDESDSEDKFSKNDKADLHQELLKCNIVDEHNVSKSSDIFNKLSSISQDIRNLTSNDDLSSEESFVLRIEGSDMEDESLQHNAFGENCMKNFRETTNDKYESFETTTTNNPNKELKHIVAEAAYCDSIVDIGKVKNIEQENTTNTSTNGIKSSVYLRETDSIASKESQQNEGKDDEIVYEKVIKSDEKNDVNNISIKNHLGDKVISDSREHSHKKVSDIINEVEDVKYEEPHGNCNSQKSQKNLSSKEEIPKYHEQSISNNTLDDISINQLPEDASTSPVEGMDTKIYEAVLDTTGEIDMDTNKNIKLGRISQKNGGMLSYNIGCDIENEHDNNGEIKRFENPEKNTMDNLNHPIENSATKQTEIGDSSEERVHAAIKLVNITEKNTTENITFNNALHKTINVSSKDTSNISGKRLEELSQQPSFDIVSLNDIDSTQNIECVNITNKNPEVHLNLQKEVSLESNIRTATIKEKGNVQSLNCSSLDNAHIVSKEKDFSLISSQDNDAYIGTGETVDIGAISRISVNKDIDLSQPQCNTHVKIIHNKKDSSINSGVDINAETSRDSIDFIAEENYTENDITQTNCQGLTHLHFVECTANSDSENEDLQVSQKSVNTLNTTKSIHLSQDRDPSCITDDIATNSNDICDLLEKHKKQSFVVQAQESAQLSDTNMQSNNNLGNLEDIRNSLKVQLSSLRTRKKNHILQPMTKVVESDMEFNKKILDSETNIISTDSTEAPNVILNFIPSDNSCLEKISESPVSNKTNLPAIEKEMDRQEELNVFDEIRKIIRSKKDLHSRIEHIGVSLINNSKTASYEINTKGKVKVCENENSLQGLSLTTENVSEGDIYPNSNSPFVSNTLDEFLTENSKLNVSYKIPQLGAEKDLVSQYSNAETPPILFPKYEENKQEKCNSKEPSKFKAKTLAEKRKLLEKSRLKEVRKIEKIRKRQEKEMTEKQKTGKTESSFVLYYNTKIWVKSTKPNHCFAAIGINASPQSCASNISRRPSLLNYLKDDAFSRLKYKPGPLCKKSELQAYSDEWTTRIKSLPKVFLEVMPEIGKPFAPCIIQQLPQHEGIISDSLIDFALSVLKCKHVSDKPVYKFNLSYENNQDNILVVKEKPKIPIPQCQISYNISIENEISSVVNNLLNYVEIKMLEPELIKDEVQLLTVDSQDDNSKPKEISDNVSVIMKRQKKSRMNYELQRLSCKVVNVIIDGENSSEDCDKDYCKLGCVCHSLRCDTFIETHCKKIDCMFECKCPKVKTAGTGEDKMTFSAGTDILSCETVSIIEDRAKKDLARVEKEFTQTIICTNDKAIVVGAGNRYKSRRVLKTPKKYTQYFNVSEGILKRDKRYIPQKKYNSCKVVLERINLTGIIPFCLQHQLYNCFCGGKAPYMRINTENQSTEIENQTREIQRMEKNTTSSDDRLKSSRNSDTLSEVLYSTTGRPLRKKRFEDEQKHSDENFHGALKRKRSQDLDENSESVPEQKKKCKQTLRQEIKLENCGESTICQRIKPISYQYKRNKLNHYSIVNILQGDFINNITEADLVKIKLNAKRSSLSDSDMLKLALLADKRKQLNMESVPNQLPMHNAKPVEMQRHKRKQYLEVRKDYEDAGISKIETNIVLNENTRCVFDGEVIVRDPEWLRKLGRRALVDGYCRLLPYKALIKSLNSNKVKIWCLKTNSFKLLINKADKEPPPNYVDIRLVAKKTNVIKWILCNRLPDEYDEENLSFILVQVKSHFEIRGVCTQIYNSKSDTSVVQHNTIPEYSNNSDIDMVNNSNILGNFENVNESDVTELRHLDIDGTVKTLFIRKQQFVLQELVAEECDNSEDVSVSSTNLYMWAALPEVYRMYKWKMIYLNRDFTYLYFKNIKYSIKYKDLVNTVEMARNEGCTLIVKNSLLSSAYEHVLFAIYFDPHFTDRIFIGPYFKQYSRDDIETLRYINQSLVSSEAFSQLQGKTDYKVEHWLVERPYKFTAAAPNETVDLTKSSDNINSENLVQNELKCKSQDNILMVNRFPPLVNYITNDQQIIWHKDKPIYVRNCKPRKPEEFNRFIVTNIPNFGYLGAYNDPNGTIEVSWPFERKVLQFANSSAVRDFLRERFTQLLQPVPETFKIDVVVLAEIDFTSFQPIDSDFLNGRCIVGEFGIYNFQCITEEFCLRVIKVPKLEITKLFARKAQDFVRRKVEELADLLEITRDSQDYNIITILESAKKEIKQLELTHLNYLRSVEIMENDVVKKMTELHKLISKLPQENRNTQSIILSNTIKIRPNKFHSREVIEISDSEDELPPKPKSVKGETKDVTDISLEGHQNKKPRVVAKISPFSTSSVTNNSKLKHAGVISENCKPVSILPKPLPSSTVISSTYETEQNAVNSNVSDCISLPNSSHSLTVTASTVPVWSGGNFSSFNTLSSKTKLPSLKVKSASVLLCPASDVENAARGSSMLPTSSAHVKNELTINRISKETSQQSSNNEGIKLVKTTDGKFVLVSHRDKGTRIFKKISPNGPSNGSKHRIIIQNNKIVSKCPKM